MIFQVFLPLSVIRDTFEYFITSDSIIEKTQVSLEEFEAMTKETTKILRREESVRFFKAIYNALPKKNKIFRCYD
jgi:hypothetical protein